MEKILCSDCIHQAVCINKGLYIKAEKEFRQLEKKTVLFEGKHPECSNYINSEVLDVEEKYLEEKEYNKDLVKDINRAFNRVVELEKEVVELRKNINNGKKNNLNNNGDSVNDNVRKNNSQNEIDLEKLIKIILG